MVTMTTGRLATLLLLVVIGITTVEANKREWLDVGNCEFIGEKKFYQGSTKDAKSKGKCQDFCKKKMNQGKKITACEHDRVGNTYCYAHEGEVQGVNTLANSLTNCYFPHKEEKGHFCGRVSGDPHVNTYDWDYYNCQGTGEFVISECPGVMKVQGRFVPTEYQKHIHSTVVRAGAIWVNGFPTVQLTLPENNKGNDEGICEWSFHIDEKEYAVDEFKKVLTEAGVVVDDSDTWYFEYPGTGVSVEMSVMGALDTTCMASLQVCVSKDTCPCDDKNWKKDGCPKRKFWSGVIGTPNGNKKDDWILTAINWKAKYPNKYAIQQPKVSKQNQDRGELNMGDVFCTDNHCIRDEEDSLFVHDEDVPGAINPWSRFNCTVPLPWDPEESDDYCKGCCDVYSHCYTDEPMNDCLLECDQFIEFCGNNQKCKKRTCDFAMQVVGLEEDLDGLPMCDEILPTMAPVTEAPNPSPTKGTKGKPTKAPTPKIIAPVPAPTLSPIDYPPIDKCKNDVKLIKINGETPLKKKNNGKDLKPIKVVARDDGEITFQFKNVFGSELEYVFVDYYDEHRATNCERYKDVGKGDTLDFTSICMASNGKTLVDVWIADATWADAESDTAQVPQCCHKPVRNNSPVVHYIFEILCVCAEEA